MSDEFSVIIVGAGPTGLVLANLLGQAGIRTLLVEANKATVSEPRAVSIDDESLRVVQQMGLLDAVCSEIVSGYGSEYLSPRGRRFLKVKPRSQPYGHPRRNAFRQPIFEAQLRDGIVRHTSVQTRFECRAERFLDDGARVTLELTYADGRTEVVSTQYLIGCDGSWSRTREALGFTLVGDSLDERWLIVDLEDCPSDSPETIVYCDPRRPGILLPGPRDTRRYEFKLVAGETDADLLAEASVARLLRDHDGVPEARIIRKTVYHFHARIADHWGRERVWLAGDAAHLMPPFAGQGMNGGVRDAANLAWKLAAVTSGRMGPGLIESYERERKTHIRQMIRLALRMGQIFGPSSALHGLAIRASFRLLGIWPAARSFFAEMKYKPAPRFDEGFLLERQLSRRGIVGRMLPQPRVSGSPVGERLDDRLGNGFALLAIDLDSQALASVSLGVRWNALIGRRVTLQSADVPEFKSHSGQILLIRPDRYVMARFSVDEAAAIGPELDMLLEQTWHVGAGPIDRRIKSGETVLAAVAS